jgi:hypothetical protein
VELALSFKRWPKVLQEVAEAREMMKRLPQRSSSNLVVSSVVGDY